MGSFFDVFEIYRSNVKKNENVGRGTEAFPDLGAHCQHPDCQLLDFLPFDCDRCRQTFCLDHRTYKSHGCERPDDGNRKVFVCMICSISIETTGNFGTSEKAIIENHLNSKDCDPAKKNRPRCPASRCKETLTFSNNHVCRCCNVKFCLKHRFPAAHSCKSGNAASCAQSGRGSGSSAGIPRSVQAY